MTFRRRTLKETARFEGVGLHSAIPVKVAVHPASGGIFFRLGGARVEAKAENVTDTTRSTRLGEVGTIEHLMSALAGLEITDAEVELDAPELPGLDGSSRGFVEGLLAAGLEDGDEWEAKTPFKRVFFQEEGGKLAASRGEGAWRYLYDMGERWPNQQAFERDDVVASYREEIAPARTFALTEELPLLEKYGLGRGLDVDSAVVLGPDGYANEVRFPDEPARHKLLDLMGDLYLSGIPIRARNVVAERTGHRANVKAAAMIAAAAAG